MLHIYRLFLTVSFRLQLGCNLVVTWSQTLVFYRLFFSSDKVISVLSVKLPAIFAVLYDLYTQCIFDTAFQARYRKERILVSALTAFFARESACEICDTYKGFSRP